MRSLLLLITLGAIVAFSFAQETPKDDGAVQSKAQHKYRMQRMKKMVLTQLTRIQNSDQPEETKHEEMKGVYDRFKKALHHNSKASSPAATKTHQATKHKQATAEAMEGHQEKPNSQREELAQAVETFGKEVGDFNQAHGKGMKRTHKGASLRRLAEESAGDQGQSGQRKRRSSAPVKPLRTSFARVI